MILAFAAVSIVVANGAWRLLAFFLAISGACGLGIFVVLQIREWMSGSLAGAEIKDDLRRPVITGHQIRDVGGLILVAASAAALVAGMPTVWYFFAVPIGAGVVVGLIMHRAHRSVTR